MLKLKKSVKKFWRFKNVLYICTIIIKQIITKTKKTMRTIKNLIEQFKINYNLKPIRRTKLKTNIVVDIYKNGSIEVVEIKKQ